MKSVLFYQVEFLIKNGANLNLVASKRDVSKGAKLTPRELAAATQFEPMSVFDKTPGPVSQVSSGSQAQQPAIDSDNTDLPSTEAELEAMIQERIDKALAAKLTELMKAEQKEKEASADVPAAEKMKSDEDVEVEAAMERMRRDEALERGESR